MRVLFLLLVPAIMVADSLVLKSGEAITGTYAGGDPRSIRFVVGDQVKMFPVENVIRIVFENTSVATGNGADQTWPKAGTGARPGLVSAHDIPDEQRKFCEIVQDYRAANIRFSNEANPIKRAEMRKPDPYDWEPRLVSVLGTSGQFDKWAGTVRFHLDGRHIAMSFFPDCEGASQSIEFATATHYVFGSKESNTMIPLHSAIADVLGQTSPNQSVTVSGHLFYLAHGNLGNYSTGQKAEFRQRYKSAPNYPAASVAAPYYLAAFDSIALKR
jgi:hypothetical protein